MTNSAAIVLDTQFLIQVEDTRRWEDRFDVLVDELRREYGPQFIWSSAAAAPDPDIDVMFVLYPPGNHDRVVSQRLVEAYIASKSGRLIYVYVIAVGRNSRNARVVLSDVLDVVNNQCIPNGVKAAPHRALQPEELDDEVRAILVRLYTRRRNGVVVAPDESIVLDSSTVSSSNQSILPAYDRNDL